MRCPKCKEIITELIYEEEQTIERKFSAGTHGVTHYSDLKTIPIASGYKCPVCKQTICRTEQEAEGIINREEENITPKDLKPEVWTKLS